MALTTLDAKTALVVIDLQRGVVALPTVHPSSEIVERSVLLLDAFRRHGLPVVLVRVTAGAPGRNEQGRPGGDFPAQGYENEVGKLKSRYAFLADAHARRLVRRYGTRAAMILGDARSTEDLGRNFGSDLYEAEVRYLIAQEWARTSADILWRRSKLGLTTTAAEREQLAAFKVPKSYAFGPLPKTSTGKIQKYVLREQEWAGKTKRVN